MQLGEGGKWELGRSFEICEPGTGTSLPAITHSHSMYLFYVHENALIHRAKFNAETVVGKNRLAFTNTHLASLDIMLDGTDDKLSKGYLLATPNSTDSLGSLLMRTARFTLFSRARLLRLGT